MKLNIGRIKWIINWYNIRFFLLPFNPFFKGALMQIWKSADIWKSYENKMLKISH